jgi:hypothetical protein
MQMHLIKKLYRRIQLKEDIMKTYLSLNFKALVLIPIVVIFTITELNAQYTITNSALNVGNPGGLRTGNDSQTRNAQNIDYDFIMDIEYGGVAANMWSQAVQTPFPIEFGGIQFNEFCVSKNGLLTFSTQVAGSTVLSSLNQNSTLPNPDLPDYTIAYLWDEYTEPTPDPWSGSYYGAIYMGYEGTAPNRQLWILNYRWAIGQPDANYYYALVFNESSSEFYVIDMNTYNIDPLSATIGAQINSTTANQVTTGLNSPAGSPDIVLGYLASNSHKPENNEYYIFQSVPFLAVDAAVTALDAPTPPATPGVNNIEITLTNYGTAPLTSATLKYRIDGGPTSSYAWTGNIPSTQSLSNISIGSTNLSPIVNTLEVWLENPNGTSDDNPLNDSIIESVYVCSPLVGNYTLGLDAADDFSSFNEMALALTTCGVGGPVTIDVDPGTYVEQVELGVIPGASTTNTVSVKSATSNQNDVVLTYPASDTDKNGNYLIKLNETSFISFEHLTFERTGTNEEDFSTLLFFNGFSSHVTVSNCRFNGIQYSDYPWPNNSYLLYAQKTEYCTFDQNLFTNGDYGMSLLAPNNDRASFNTVTNNTFLNIFRYPVGASYQDEFTFSYNNVRATSPQYASSFLATFTSVQNNSVISHNSFIDEMRTSRYSIRLNTSSSNNPSTFSNNFIYANAIQPSSYQGHLLLEITSLDYYNIYHNTVLLEGILNDIESASFFIGSSVDNTNIRNNHFINRMGGQAVHYDRNAYTSLATNFNNYYSTGSNPFRFDNTYYPTLAAYQAGTGRDGNSHFINPVFNGPIDFHLGTANLDNLGTPVAQVTDDLDGDPRDPVTPDIGADEFSAPAGNIEVLSIAPMIGSPGAQDIKINFKNSGSSVINSATFGYSVNGSVFSAANAYAGNLAVNASTGPFTIDNYVFSDPINYIEVWPDLVNGVPDGFSGDDTAKYVLALCSPLSGTNSIGGPGADYPSFSEALEALIYCGVGGPVVMEVNDGTYTEKLEIPPISGASSTNTITFISASNNSSNVTLTYPASSSPIDNYTVFLNGADYIRFEKMTLKRTGTNERYARIVTLGDGAHRNVIKDCEIIGFPVNTADYSEDQALFFDIKGSIDNYNSIIGNTFLFGAQAIVMYGIDQNSTSNQLNLVVSGNTISGQYGDAVFIQSAQNLTFTYNKVTNSSPNLNNNLVTLYKVQYMQVTHNEMHKTGGRFRKGLALEFCVGDASNYLNVANNIVSCEVVNNIQSYNELFAFSLNYGQYVNFNYNSAHLYSTGTGAATYSAALRMNFSYYVRVRNDILINMIASSDPVYNSNLIYDTYNVFSGSMNSYNNNVVFNTGKFGEEVGVDAQTFADWQSSGFDLNSSNFLPIFQSNTDLHTQDVRLFSTAAPLAWVTNDIDGEPRDPVHPYAGADEYENPTSSIAVLEILPLSTNPGIQNIIIDFKNNGTQAVTSADLNFEINGIPNAVAASFAGNLASGSTQAAFNIGTYNFVPGSYIIKAYPESVNLLPDEDLSDDTATYYLNVCIPLNGTYSLGGPMSDYADIQGAIDALENCGVNGPVVFKLETGVYTGKYDFGSVVGVSATNTITFQSATGNYTDVSIQYPAANFNNDIYSIKLNDANWLIFKDLSIKSIGTTELYANVVILDDNANNITFDGCYIEGVNNTGGSFADRTLVLRESGTTNCNDLTFKDCIFKYGGKGISLSGNSAADPQTGLEISDCEFINQYSSAIELKYLEAPVIHENTLTTSSSLISLEMMHIEECYDAFQITKNQLSKLDNAFNVGIYIKSCVGDALNKGLIANNFISTRRVNNGGAFGLYIDNSRDISALYNSINLVGTTDYAASRALFVNGGSGITIKNNSLVNSLGGYAFYLNGGGLSSSDYNNLHTNGLALAYAAGIQATLTDWQSATGLDGNSISIDAWYFSDNDLHTGSVFLSERGTALPEVTVDIDDEARGVTPDIGADEFTPFALNVWISDIDPLLPTGCPQDLSIDFRNAGTATITSVEFEYALNGNPMGSFNWAGNLLSKQTSVGITVGNLQLALGEHVIKVYPVLVNGAADEFARDDTITLEINITNPIPDPPSTTDALVLFGSPTPDVSAAGTNITWYSENPPLNQIGIGNNFASPETGIGVYTYYATQTDALGCESSPDSALLTIYDNDLIMWNGKVYINGSGPGGAPDVTDVTKDFYVMGANGLLTNNARVRSMKIYESSDLTVTSDFTLSIINEIENNGLLTVENDGSLVQEDVADNNSGTGNYRILREGVRDSDEFQIWSSPIQAAQLMGAGGVFDGSNPCRTMVWNASSQRWKYDYVSGSVYDCGGGNITFTGRFLMFDDPADNLMDPGRGYFIPGQVGTPLIVFSGKINNGPIVKPVFETVSTSPYTGDDWNLLGNPYPSALGITEWLDANAAILKTNAIYLWDDDGSGGSDYDEYDDYATVNQFGFVGGENGNGKYPTAPVGIATAQGFFIEASASGNVTFSNDMRITGENDKFYKTQPDDNPRLWINLNNQEGLQRQTLIGFASDATFQKDEKYDAPVLNANGILSIGSMLESTPMAIQAQPFLVEGDERFIPLHVLSKDGGKAILSFIRNEAMDGIEVYLKIPNQLAEIFIDDSEIDLDLNKGINDGYALIFRKGNVLSNSSINKNFGWKPIYTNDELMVEIIGSMEPDTRIEVLDLKGVVHETVNVTDQVTRINTQNWAAGMYLVHLKSGSRDEVKRVVIR